MTDDNVAWLIRRLGPVVKGRIGAESLNLPGDAVRILERWLDHALRGHADILV